MYPTEEFYIHCTNLSEDDYDGDDDDNTGKSTILGRDPWLRREAVFNAIPVQFSRSTGVVSQTGALLSQPTWLGWLFGWVLITPHAIIWVFTVPYQFIFPVLYQAWLFWTLDVLLRNSMGVDEWGADFSRSFGWLTGGRSLYTSHKYTVFYRFRVFYYCLGFIRLIIDGYPYVTRLGWVFSRFFTHEKNCCCTAAVG